MKVLLNNAARDPRFVAGATVLLLFTFAGLFAPWIAPFDPSSNLGRESYSLTPPSAAHWLGTDIESRDVLSRLLFASRASLQISITAVALATGVGAAIGLVAAAFGGWVDRLLMRLSDLFLSIPSLVLLLAAGAFFGKSPWTLALVLGLAGWMQTARLVRADATVIFQKEFVLAATGLGLGRGLIIIRHIVPHVMATIVTSAAMGIGGVLAAEASLSFLGFGVPEPMPSFGDMIQSGMEQVRDGWWVSLFPAVSIGLCVAASALLGDALLDARRASRVVRT